MRTGGDRPHRPARAGELVELAIPQPAAIMIMGLSVSFGLLDEKSKVKPGPGVTQQNLFG